jgi:monofunctional biosynthetic peptidoglycan transglycosylase
MPRADDRVTRPRRRSKARRRGATWRWRRWLWLLLALPLALWLLGLLLWRVVLPPATPLMALRSIEQGAWVAHRTVPLEAVAPALARAVIASEDTRFCQHRGIDLDAVQDALADYRERGRLRGASTITMQVARNLFLWDGGGLLRKGLEAPLALALDALWPKRRILEVYLNIAEWGPGVFGAEAAAWHWFGKPAARLSADEAARLVAILPSPRRWRASEPTPWLRGRAAIIRARSGQLAQWQLACWQAQSSPAK